MSPILRVVWRMDSRLGSSVVVELAEGEGDEEATMGSISLARKPWRVFFAFSTRTEAIVRGVLRFPST